MRCLACELHLIVRVAMRFNKEAVVAGRHVVTLDKLVELLGKRHINVDWETPEMTPRSMKGGIANIVIDVIVPDMKKKTVKATVNSVIKLIDGNDLDEGFVEVYESSDIIDLLPDAEG